MSAPAATLLVDNGSLQPESILKARTLALALAEKLGEPVEAVSMLHSDKVPSARLHGQPAETLRTALQRRLEAGLVSFKLIPLFIGPSEAVSATIPSLVHALRVDYPPLLCRLAPPLGQDDALVPLLADQVKTVLQKDSMAAHDLKVALVDHGSPTEAVTEVRNRLAKALADTLRTHGLDVTPCSMERRPGEAYAFNEPLLEGLLGSPEWKTANVIVAMLFLLPGRHAGADGDIAHICRDAGLASPGLKTHITALLGEHPGLIDLLARRAAAASPV